jgi:conjugative relaxase-like TrwC/TraI family protein
LLTISSVDCALGAGASAGVADYVLGRADRPAAFARGDYYVSDYDIDSDQPTLWHGAPAALSQLGVQPGQAVERDQLIAALQGQHVSTGAQIRRSGHRTVERDGIFVVEEVVKSVDLTFSAPKSVSVLWSQADPDERRRIEADVLVAAQAAIDHMATTKACVHRRTPDGARIREPAAGVAAALSLHVTARRAASDAAPAPQLHVHGVVVGLLRQDGMLVTPDPWKWFRDGAAREGGALGRAVLAERLASRGYEIEAETGKRQRYFELAGVPATLRAAFSGRTREVETRAKALELAIGRPVRGAALAVLAKETRTKKNELDHAEVAAWWDAVAAEHGFTRREAGQLRGPYRQRDLAVLEGALARSIIERLAAEGPTVSTAEARAIALEAAAGRAAPARALEILGELQKTGIVIALEQDRVTTKPIRDLERYVLAAARTTRPAAPLPHDLVAHGIATAAAALGERRHLDPEQIAAVDAITNGATWTNLTGRAGTGKGPTLEAAAHAYRGAGWQVLACAVDGTTAQRLAAQVKSRGYTIDGLTTRIDHGRLTPTPQTLVIVDEASKVDTARWAELARLVHDHNIRILAVGDEGQLQSITLPGLFPELCDAAPTVRLNEIRRHRDATDPSREHQWLGHYQQALHAGEAHQAIAILQEHDALRLHDTRPEAMVALVEDWNSWRHDHSLDQTMLLVHGTNGDVDTANLLAQRARYQAGELSADSVPAPDRDYQLHAGDLIVLRGAPLLLIGGDRIENGTGMRITCVNPRRDQIQVALTPAHARAPVCATIDLTPLRQTWPGLRQPALRLAYAMHPNPAQGATVDRTAALGHPIADRNATYVADTRARYGHTIHLAREDLGTDGTDADRLDRYAQSISDSRSRAASIRYRAAARDLSP